MSRFKLYVIGMLFILGSTTHAFAVLVVNPAQPITDVVTVQPIIVSDNGGVNTANYF